MGGSLSEGLRTVFAVVLSCLVIGFVFMQWSTVKESGNAALTDSNSTITQMDEAKYTQYDAAVITGSEVVNVIKLHSNDQLCITVKNGSNEAHYIYADVNFSGAGDNLALARDKTSVNYINPNSKYTGQVVRNATTDAIVGIVFTKS